MFPVGSWIPPILWISKLPDLDRQPPRGDIGIAIDANWLVIHGIQGAQWLFGSDAKLMITDTRNRLNPYIIYGTR